MVQPGSALWSDVKVWGMSNGLLSPDDQGPNLTPKAPVDYVLVAMEPSLKGWAQDIPDAQEKIAKGFRNFCGVWLLHSSISEFPCRDGETYYLTDLAKGAMATSSKGAGSKDKYEWYPLLEREIALVSKPDVRVISIGSRVGGFLSEKCLDGHAGTIPHYSGSGAVYRGREIPGREKEFEKFAASLVNVPSYLRRPSQSCETGHVPARVTPTASHKKLLFDYKVRFERIREKLGWRRWQRK